MASADHCPSDANCGKTKLELRGRALSVLAWNRWAWVRVSYPGILLIGVELREFFSKKIYEYSSGS